MVVILLVDAFADDPIGRKELEEFKNIILSSSSSLLTLRTDIVIKK
jgi:hypothetical protein